MVDEVLIAVIPTLSGPPWYVLLVLAWVIVVGAWWLTRLVKRLRRELRNTDPKR